MIYYNPNEDQKIGKYSFSYQWLREDYRRYTLMSDEDFLASIVDVLHFACYVCFIKELQTEDVLSDSGVIHELIHFACEQRNRARGDAEPEVSTTSLATVRDLFNRDCCLA